MESTLPWLLSELKSLDLIIGVILLFILFVVWRQFASTNKSLQDEREKLINSSIQNAAAINIALQTISREIKDLKNDNISNREHVNAKLTHIEDIVEHLYRQIRE